MHCTLVQLFFARLVPQVWCQQKGLPNVTPVQYLSMSIGSSVLTFEPVLKPYALVRPSSTSRCSTSKQISLPGAATSEICPIRASTTVCIANHSMRYIQLLKEAGDSCSTFAYFGRATTWLRHVCAGQNGSATISTTCYARFCCRVLGTCQHMQLTHAQQGASHGGSHLWEVAEDALACEERGFCGVKAMGLQRRLPAWSPQGLQPRMRGGDTADAIYQFRCSV